MSKRNVRLPINLYKLIMMCHYVFLFIFEGENFDLSFSLILSKCTNAFIFQYYRPLKEITGNTPCHNT